MAGTTSASGEKCLDGLVAFIEWRGPDLMSGGLVLHPVARIGALSACNGSFQEHYAYPP